MTKPKALRNYFKKMYDVDLDAMSSVGVLKQFFKEKYDFDAEGSTVSEVLTSVLDSDIEPSGGGGSCDAVIVDALPEVGEEGKIYLLRRLFGGSPALEDTPVWRWLTDGFVLEETLPPITGDGIMSTIYVVGGKLYTSGYNEWIDSTEEITEGDTVSIFNEPKNPEDYIGTLGIFTNYENSVMPVTWEGNGYTSFASFPS